MARLLKLLTCKLNKCYMFICCRKEYVLAKGPNPDLRQGPDPSRVMGSQGAVGPDPSLRCGPQAGLSKGSSLENLLVSAI